MNLRQRLAICCLLGGGLVAGFSEKAIAQAASCAATIVAVDTALIDPTDSTTYVFMRCGGAVGQAFVASDTLIRSIVVWRAAAQTPYGGNLKLWITEADSAGVPQLDRKILDGPVITVPFGDGIHPIKMEWSLDPPVALPRRGRYYFAVQDWCGGNWNFYVTHVDAYAGGQVWRSGITCFDCEGCNLYRTPQRLIADDLVFTIEFCRTDVTPVHRESWGRLKVIYR